MRLILPVSLALVITCATSPLKAGQTAAGQGQVTFTKDVAPILQNNCQVCHRPGSIAPMSLLTYEQARPWARAIKEQVVVRQMPPWYIDRNVGVQHFSNDRSLTDREIETIARLSGECCAGDVEAVDGLHVNIESHAVLARERSGTDIARRHSNIAEGCETRVDELHDL